MNYGEIKSAVASWMKRSDMTSVIPTFITLTETDILRDVRVRAMESVVGITLAGETQPHPDRLIEARRLVIAGDQYLYVTPEEYELNTDARYKIFTSIGTNFYINGGTSGDTGTLTYTASFAPLAADTDTNWLTDNSPDVYLFGALRHASIYTLDDVGVAKFAQLYAGAVERVNKLEKAQALAGPLSVKHEIKEWL
jgi:hypothetical protein